MSETVIILLDRERTLRFDYNALCDVEPLLREELAAILKAGRMSMGDLRALMYAGMKWEDPRLTLERTGELIEAAAIKDENFFATAVERVFEAIVACRLFGARSPNAPAEAAPPSASDNGSTRRSATPTGH